jgi:S1-C subfamily serine protease
MNAPTRDEELQSGKRKPLPRWVVVFVILAAAGITVVAMSMSGMRGPALAWERANQSIETAWFGQTPDETGGLVVGAAAPSDPALPVAAAITAPVIIAGAPMPHADRGVCTGCHSTVTPAGTAVPAIRSSSVMTHEYRGVCANCHQMRSSALPGFGSPVAAVQVPGGPPAANARQPTEAEWQGLEVGPSAGGVVINGVEGAAQRAGVLAGDVVSSVNAVPVASVAEFLKVTDNGVLAQGTVIVRRGAQRLAFELGAAGGTQPAGGTMPGQLGTARQGAQF